MAEEEQQQQPQQQIDSSVLPVHETDHSLLESYRYINTVPGKDVRGKLIDCFQQWLQLESDQVLLDIKVCVYIMCGYSIFWGGTHGRTYRLFIFYIMSHPKLVCNPHYYLRMQLYFIILASLLTYIILNMK
jgi:hypothetical protein